MPSLLDPTGAGQGDPLGIESLLGSAVSGGAAQPSDTGAAIASFLAAANTMANAGAPTLGPPPTTAQAILGSLSAGRGAAIQNQVLPYVVQHAAIQQQQELLNYEQQLWQFNRQRAYDGFVKGGAAAVLPSAAAPAPAAGPGAATADISQLPDVQALPDQTRAPFIQAMAQVGAAPAEAALYARMVMAESGGLHLDPKTGKVITSPKGASGVAQVLPQTFLDMAQAHDDVTGSVSDLMPNLLAGAHYFHDQVAANGGDLRNGAIAYNLGPTGLADFLAGKRGLPDETQAYLAKTGAPAPGSVLVADSSGRTVPQPGAPGATGGAVTDATDPLVQDPLTGAMVPRSVELAAQGVGRGSPTPMEAHAGVIKDYLEKKALMPTYRPGGVPGQQVSSQGEVSAAAPGTLSWSAITPQERQTLFPQVPAWQDIIVQRDPNNPSRIMDHKMVDMGPEPQVPISDEDAKKPVEEGGVGNAYQPGAIYVRGARTGLPKPMQMERQAAGPQGPPGASQPIQTPNQLAIQSQQFQQTQELENQVVHSPIYTQWAQGAQRFDAVLASLNQRTRVGDQAAIESLAKVFDPGAVVTEGKLQMAATYGGVAQQLQNALGKITGESGLPDDVRQQIVNLATAEMKTRDAAVLGQIARSRASAQAKGINPDQVMPLFQTTALGTADAEARNPPKGVVLAPPVTLQNGQFVRGEAPPATTSSGANLLPVPSPAQFAAMSGAGLSAIITDGQAHPERYSPAYRAALGAELQRRGAGR
jgi:hypothetical protein